MAGQLVTDTPELLKNTVADTVYRLSNTGGHSRLYFEIAAVVSPPDKDSATRDLLFFGAKEFVSHGAGQAIFVWGSVAGAKLPCTYNVLAG